MEGVSNSPYSSSRSSSSESETWTLTSVSSASLVHSKNSPKARS